MNSMTLVQIILIIISLIIILANVKRTEATRT